MSQASLRLLQLRALYPDLSRNRHFELFQDPQNSEALRLRERLRGLAAAIRAMPQETTVTHSQDGCEERYVVHTCNPELTATWTVDLDTEEMLLLLQSQDVAPILARPGIEQAIQTVKDQPNSSGKSSETGPKQRLL